MNKSWMSLLACALFVSVLVLSGYARADVPVDQEVAVSVDIAVVSVNVVTETASYMEVEDFGVDVPGYAVLKCCIVTPCRHQNACNLINVSPMYAKQKTLKDSLVIIDFGPLHRWIKA